DPEADEAHFGARRCRCTGKPDCHAMGWIHHDGGRFPGTWVRTRDVEPHLSRNALPIDWTTREVSAAPDIASVRNRRQVRRRTWPGTAHARWNRGNSK